MVTEYITKKIAKEDDSVLKYVQAHYQLEKGERATEIEVIGFALRHVAEELYGFKKNKKAKYAWKDIEGSIKGGVRSTEKDIDKLLYGV